MVSINEPLRISNPCQPRVWQSCWIHCCSTNDLGMPPCCYIPHHFSPLCTEIWYWLFIILVPNAHSPWTYSHRNLAHLLQDKIAIIYKGHIVWCDQFQKLWYSPALFSANDDCKNAWQCAQSLPKNHVKMDWTSIRPLALYVRVHKPNYIRLH